MLKECLLAGLAGFGMGVASGLYLLLVLYAAAAAKGLRRTLLVASWPLHAAAPPLLTILLVLPNAVPQGGSGVYWFMYAWCPPYGGAVIWYLRTHPNPLRLDLKERRASRG